MGQDQNKNRQEPLAIVGIGCIFPRAGSLAEYWCNIKEGVDAITEVPATHWKPSDYFDEDPNSPDMTYARRGGFIDPIKFDPLLYGMSPNNIEATDTTQLLGMVAAREALLDAGYATARDSDDGRQFDRDRTSVILGVTGTLELVIPLGARLGHPIWRRALHDAGVDETTAEEVIKRIAEGYVPWQENSFPGLLGNVAAGRIANRFDLGGTNCVVDAACASSLSAIHMAAMELYAGRCDMAISGGVDTFNDIFMYMCFSKTPALSPTGNSRPFHSNGDGTILGEGIGVVILKRLADAERDRDRIYAVIKGIGTSSDGKGNAIYAPSPGGQQKALRDAYQQADVKPRTIELVEAHGTGTKVGDAVEASALSGVYREDRPQGTWCAIGSVKSMIGHTKAAAGVAGLIKVAMALQNKVLPPTIKVDQPLQELTPGTAPVYINTIKRPWTARPEHPRRAAISAFGFGGSNFHAVLEEQDRTKQEAEWNGRVLIFAFSNDDRKQLAGGLDTIAAAKADWKQLRRSAAQSLRDYDTGHAWRLVLVIDRDRTDIEKLIAAAGTIISQHGRDYLPAPEGAFLGRRTPPGRMAFMFPGQGAQYTGMLRDLACQFPQMLSALDEADTAVGIDRDGLCLSDRIYPIPKFDKTAQDRDSLALRATDIAQPAIGAVSNGAARVLQDFGIRADAAAGHSFGELTALNYAGWYKDTDLFRLAQKRGQLMQQGEGDRGSMLAVIATPEDLYQVIEEHQLDLIIANHNAPKQLVLSGATKQIEKAESILSGNRIRCTRLPVAAAFHSSFVAGAEKPLAEFIHAINFAAGRLPVYSNTTAAAYNYNVDQARAQLAGQLAQPVEFVTEIETMYEEGIRTFVEVGPSNIITGLVGSILADREHYAIALDASRGRNNGQYDLALLLARLSALGHDCDLAKWDAGYLDRLREEMEPAMSIPISGANYVMPREKSPPLPKQPPAASVQTPVEEIQVPAPQTAGGNSGAALEAIQQSILALQKMQEQTAKLHRQYLEGQENAQQTIQQLIRQQQQLITGAPVTAPARPGPVVDETMQQAAAAGVSEPPETGATDNEQPAADKSRYQNILLEVVADKTGYPVDMLSLDMSLDTDLGIDSIKRVEILSALQEKLPGIQKVQPEDLGTFQLLQHIVEYLADGDKETSVIAENQAVPEAGIFQQTLLEVVAEKTGYPVDMLSLDMNLDSDLGIDSIKRVEILSALQERLPDAPPVKPEDLGTLQTLRQIVEFTGAGEETTAAPAGENEFDSTGFQAVLLEVVADKTGYPVDMLNLDMNLDSDLGIDSIKRVEILSALQERLPEAPPVKPEDLGELHTLQQIVAHLLAKTGRPAGKPETTAPGPGVQDKDGQRTIYRSTVELSPVTENGTAVELPADATVLVTGDGTGLPEEICRILADRQLRAEVIQADASITNEVAGLIIMVPEAPGEHYILDAFNLIQQAGRHGLRTLTGVTRLGGGFGFRGLSGADPAAAAIHGMVKTADKEWPEVNCRAVDIPAGNSDAGLAGSIVNELLTGGPLETGIGAEGPVTPALHTARVEYRHTPDDLFASDDVVVITGGARGITAEVAVALASTYGVNLLLLGRSTEPKPEPEWLSGLIDEAEIKKAIISQQDAGRKPTPRAVEDEYRRIIANREILATLERIGETGVTARYRSADVRQSHKVAAIIGEARKETGPIRGIIHGAGVLADSLIADKTPDQFNRVYSTKVDGLHSLLKATAGDDLKIMVMFSSSTARFGRKGQVDYAAANEVLNKMAQREQARRPGCRVISINWGPWEGGMVTPQLKTIFESEGVGLIPLRSGADYLMQEIAAQGPVEMVILGSEPAPATDTTSERPAFNDSLQLAFERRLGMENFPILNSHVMNGKAVLPAALIIEWLAHGAMHNNPGMSFIGFDDFRILKGVVLENGGTLALQIMAGPPRITSEHDVIQVELRSDGNLHARANIILSSEYEKQGPSSGPLPAGDYPFHDGEYYTNGQLFHGKDLHGIQSITACAEQGITGTVNTAPPPSAWSREPIRSTWLADPLVLDSCFQMMILWSFQNTGAGSLPTAVGGYRQYKRSFPKKGIQVIARVVNHTKHNAVADIEILDKQGSLVAKLDGYECVIDQSLNEAFTKNNLSLVQLGEG